MDNGDAGDVKMRRCEDAARRGMEPRRRRLTMVSEVSQETRRSSRWSVRCGREGRNCTLLKGGSRNRQEKKKA